MMVPLSKVATKDDFFNIKKVSAAALLDAHRIPYQLMGGKPENVGSVDDVEKAASVFVRNELAPLQQRITEVNCKHPCNLNHSLLEIFRHTDYVPGGDRYA